MVSGKQRHLYTAAALLLLFVGQASAFAGGNGTASNPYEISNVDQLQNMSSDLDAHYELVSDINASETRNWNNGKGFDPIGENYDNRFNGSFDGRGHIIDGLFINRSSTEWVGLFGYTDRAPITRVGVTDVNFTGSRGIGAIAALSDHKISKVYSTGIIKSSNNPGYIGGVVGQSSGDSNQNRGFKNSYSLVDIDVDEGDDVAGLAGYSSGDITNTYTAGTVPDDIYGGGLVGFTEGGTVSSSYWDINNSGDPGSIVGTGLTTSEMTRPNAEGNMTGFDFTDIWKTEKGCNNGYPFLQIFDEKVECNSPPAIESVSIEVNESQETPRINLELSSNGESDIASYQGLSSASTFTNTSLEGEFSFPFTSSISVEDSTGLVSGSRSVDLDRNDSGHRQDPAESSLSQQYLNQTYTISNEGNDSVNYSLALQIPGTIDSKQQWNGTLKTGSSVTHTVESKGDWIEENLYKFDAPGEVTIGEQFTGTQDLEVAEQANVSWEKISTTGLVDTPGSCIQENLTEISVSEGKTENKTIGFSCSSGSIGTPSESLYDHGSYERAWYNTTLTVASNLTENSSLTWPVNKSELPRFSSRDRGSIKAVVNGKSEDVAVVEDQDNVYVTVQDDFGNSSLHKGQHSASLTYTVAEKDSDTGNESEYSITFSEEQYNTVIPGTTSTLLFTAFNYEEEPNQLYLETRDTQACQYFTVQTSYTGDEYGEQSSLRIPAGNSGTNGTGDVVLKAKVDVPNRSTLLEEGLGDTFTCRFQTGAGIGEAESLNLTVKLVDQKPPVVQAVERLIPDLPETSFIVEKEVCLPEGGEESSRLEQVQTFMEKDRCSGNLYSIPWLTGNGLMITVAGFVFVVGLRRFY